MTKQARSRKFTAKQSARLGAYLAAGLGASTVATSSSDAAIVNINIGPSGFNIGGINGGLYPDEAAYVVNFPFSGAGAFFMLNDFRISSNFGLVGLGIEFANGGVPASPINFALSTAIDGNATFSNYNYNSVFKTGPYVSANFGPDSFMGFRTAQGNYGWLEVTWDSNASQFEILSGAYEDVAGVAIVAGQGAGPAAVPEPGTWAAAALLAGGAAFTRWRKRRDEAEKEAA